MTCADFQRKLPDFLEEGGAELQAHLNECASCSEVTASLQAIVSEARQLQACEEPSPRVWNAIEVELRREGLIRQPQPHPYRSLLPYLTQRWGSAAWLVPVAAALLVGAALTQYHRAASGKLASDTAQSSMVVRPVGDISDEQLLQEVSAQAPMMRATYERNLNDVNAYIRDAQETVEANPRDEDAQQALMDAYGQKSMIYEMALDRSLP